MVRVKDDLRHFRHWVDHHAPLVGHENLIIFDNESQNPEMLDYLRALQDRCVVCTFAGYHNALNIPYYFMPLYEAIRDSSEAYCLIDTDERLCWMLDAETLAPAERFLDYVMAADFGGEQFLPGFWLHNQTGRADLFHMVENGKDLLFGLVGGKPILSSKMPIPRFLNHNCQLELDAPSGIGATNLLVVHLRVLWPEERTRINIEKMKKHGDLDASLDEKEAVDLLKRQFKSGDLMGNPEKWTREILSFGDIGTDEGDSLSDGLVRLRELSLEHASDVQRAVLQSMLNNPGISFGQNYAAHSKYADTQKRD